MKKIPLSTRNQDDNADPLVSIVCPTYNHEKYISQCIEGFLRQETSFPVEIIVHDDASEDGTTDLVRSFDHRFPGVFKNIYNPVNRWPETPHAVQMVNRFCRGKYIAFCEGDDRWTDPEKLQIQVDLLESQPNVAGCFHQSRLIDEDGVVFEESYFTPRKPLLSLRDCLEGSLSSYASCSFVFRRSAVSDPPPWLELRCSDMYLELGVALQGDIRFIDRTMSDYRKHPGGAWTSLPHGYRVFEICVRLEILLLFPPFKEEFSEIIRNRIKGFLTSLQSEIDFNASERERLSGLDACRLHKIGLLEKLAEDRFGYISSLEAEREEHAKGIAALRERTSRSEAKAATLNADLQKIQATLGVRLESAVRNKLNNLKGRLRTLFPDE